MLEEPLEWVDKAVQRMEQDVEIKVANPVPNHLYKMAEQEAQLQDSRAAGKSSGRAENEMDPPFAASGMLR